LAATPRSDRRIPALLVSGFLGSGKTTLVRHLLRDAQARGLRLAIVSNEFGALGIDRALLGGSDEAFVELGGGCVCCQLSDELVLTLGRLREKIDPDRIVIETSGVALPYDVQLHFWREPLASWIGEDLTAVVVNAEQLATAGALDETFEDQVSSADLLLLNKIDLVRESVLPALEARLRDIEPEAPILRTRHAEVLPDVLFTPLPGERPRLPHVHDHAHSHEGFASEVVAFAAGLGSLEVAARVRSAGALRAKGFVATAEGLRLVQGVGPRVELIEPEFAPPPELVGQVVLIRKNARGG
jgi:G3E family GTPase